jgi:hypothetical protein
MPGEKMISVKWKGNEAIPRTILVTFEAAIAMQTTMG